MCGVCTSSYFIQYEIQEHTQFIWKLSSRIYRFQFIKLHCAGCLWQKWWWLWWWQLWLKNFFLVWYVIKHIYKYIQLTWIGSQSNAKAATTTNTKRVTRFRPRCDSFVRLWSTTVRQSRSINAYRPLISVNGIKYELEKNIMWKAANEMPLDWNTQNL